VIRLSHPIKLPAGLLSQTALQLKALEPRKDLIGELFPRAYQLLCEEKNFLFGSEVRELAFIETHGRRWRAGEGFDYSKVPPIAELKFDPANLEASCNLLRSWFEGIRFPKRDSTLEKYARECHKAIYRAREARKELLRARGEEDVGGVAAQDYKAFACEGLVFIGTQVWFLKDYIDYRSKGSTAQKAEQLLLAKRRKKTPTKKTKKVV
jgi:hypothetical protein